MVAQICNVTLEDSNSKVSNKFVIFNITENSVPLKIYQYLSHMHRVAWDVGMCCEK